MMPRQCHIHPGCTIGCTGEHSYGPLLGISAWGSVELWPRPVGEIVNPHVVQHVPDPVEIWLRDQIARLDDMQRLTAADMTKRVSTGGSV